MYFWMMYTINSSSKQTKEPNSKQENTEFLGILKLDWSIIWWRDLNIFPPEAVFGILFTVVLFKIQTLIQYDIPVKQTTLVP